MQERVAVARGRTRTKLRGRSPRRSSSTPSGVGPSMIPTRRKAQHEAWFRLLIHSALPYQWVWTTPGYEAATVWVPPGCPELNETDEALLESDAQGIARSTGRFGVRDLRPVRGRPPLHAEDHYYLGLLGTHTEHRGAGIGMRRLCGQPGAPRRPRDAGLPRIDEPGEPRGDTRESDSSLLRGVRPARRGADGDNDVARARGPGALVRSQDLGRVGAPPYQASSSCCPLGRYPSDRPYRWSPCAQSHRRLCSTG